MHDAPTRESLAPASNVSTFTIVLICPTLGEINSSNSKRPKSKHLMSLVLHRKVSSCVRKSLFNQLSPPKRQIEDLTMVEVRAPHHLQPVIAAMELFWHDRFRMIVAVKADALSLDLITIAPTSFLQIFINERGVDDRVLAGQEDGGMAAQKFVLPQDVLGPEEGARECVRHSHVLGAEVPQKPFVGELGSAYNKVIGNIRLMK